jgi:hypothetical protein
MPMRPELKEVAIKIVEHLDMKAAPTFLGFQGKYQISAGRGHIAAM